MSRPKIYKTKRQFLTIRLTKQEWKEFSDMSKMYRMNKTQFATAIIRRTIELSMAEDKI